VPGEEDRPTPYTSHGLLGEGRRIGVRTAAPSFLRSKSRHHRGVRPVQAQTRLQPTRIAVDSRRWSCRAAGRALGIAIQPISSTSEPCARRLCMRVLRSNEMLAVAAP
jgi:hypothetical protein